MTRIRRIPHRVFLSFGVLRMPAFCALLLCGCTQTQIANVNSGLGASQMLSCMVAASESDCHQQGSPTRISRVTYVSTPGAASTQIFVHSVTSEGPARQKDRELSHFDLDAEVNDPKAARALVIEKFGYAPFFNNLKFQGAAWDANIMAPEVTMPISKAAAADGFLFILFSPKQMELGLSVQSSEVESFCKRQFSDPSIGDSAKRRLLTLCAAYDCDIADAAIWKSLTDLDKDQKFAADTFVDAGLLFRAAEFCGRSDEAALLKSRLSRDLGTFDALRQVCTSMSCTPADIATIARAQIGLSNILYWALEQKAFDDPLARHAAELSEWNSERVSVALSASDAQDDLLCRDARLDAEACKTEFPHRTGMRVALLGMVQSYIETPDTVARATLVKQLLASRAKEIAGQQSYLGHIIAGLTG